MKSINANKSKFILFSLIVIALIGISATMVIRYFNAPLQEGGTQELVLKTSNAETSDKQAVRMGDNDGFSSHFSEDKQIVQALKESTGLQNQGGNNQKQVSSGQAKSDNERIITRKRSSDNLRRSEIKRHLQTASTENKHDNNPALTHRQVDLPGQSTTSQRATNSHESPTISGSSIADSKTRSQTSLEPENDDLIIDNEDHQDEIEASHRYVSVSRNIRSGSYTSGELDIVLSVHIDDLPPNGLIVKEYIPKGWDVVESVPGYQNHDVSSGKMKWLFVGSDVENMDISYKLVKTDALEVENTFEGNYIYKNISGEHISLQIDDVN